MNEITSRWTGCPYYLTPEQRRRTREMFQRKAKRKREERTMRLIDADAAITEWRRINNIDENDRGARFFGYTEIPRLLNRMPTIDAEPRKHGEWEEKEAHINEGDCEITEWQSTRCSKCGKYHTTPYMYSFNNFNFCPNCGADMRKKGGEDHETD